VDRPEVDLGRLDPAGDAAGPSPPPTARPCAGGPPRRSAHRRLPTTSAVLVGQALPHPPGRVPLLARRGPVRVQPSVDDRLPRIHHRRRLSHGALRSAAAPRRLKRLAHITAMHPEPARQLPNRQLLALMRTRICSYNFTFDLLGITHSRRQPAPTSGPHRWGQIR
jgi:hypothetical protein